MTTTKPPTMRRPVPPEMLRRGRCPFDPPAELAKLDDQAPLSRIELLNGAHAWVITGYEQARAILADTRFSSDNVRHRTAMDLRPEEAGEPRRPVELPQRADGRFLFMDPPEHTRLRRLLTGQFTVRRMQQLEARIREIAVEHLDAMRAAGNSGDVVPAFALPLPSLVICELLGVDYADRAEFQERTAVALNLTKPEEERQAASEAIQGFMRGLVAYKREHPADDLLSGLIHGDAEPALTEEELVDIATVLLGAGHETTANMLALATFALLEHPDQLALVREDPSVLDNGVDELLRYLSIIHIGPTRVATEEITVAGTTIAAGDTVLISVPQANRSAEHWPQPERLDLTRPRTSHLAFGHGVHQCLGQQLARSELRVGLAELVTRLPDLHLALDPGEVSLRTDMLVYGVHSLPVTWS
ncbi:cytochrome P450 [Amycolatopsis jiangsuensis]|uniref:Cytochrome P450 n=1 Tax=Amycolatopsis jiangsuensis TaxID=1181879 RepID=A0A840ISB7_9PSEU|nr:cytochrome P450 [Amycolatopsis jiangsuensis]MBB4683904.1 cytochrome P450 [Amycolatopsis jiangsuensis]